MNNYKLELLKKGVVAFIPRGNSMWPTLKDRGQTVILIKKTERLKRFDVGFFIRPNGQYVLHRVIQVTEKGYVFQGDGQDFTETVLEEDVIAYMEGFYRGKRYVEANNSKYLKEVERLYSNDKKRIKRVNCYLKRKAFINRIRRFLRLKVKKVVE